MKSWGVRKGAWTEEEDVLLKRCIEKHGKGKWHLVPQRAGLNRCRKSCRLRWLNYLQPNLNREAFKEDEIDLIIKLHKLLGNRWSLISGRLPGRTVNDVENYWNSHLSKRFGSKSKELNPRSKLDKVEVIRPKPRYLSSKISSANVSAPKKQQEVQKLVDEQNLGWNDVISENDPCDGKAKEDLSKETIMGGIVAEMDPESTMQCDIRGFEWDDLS